MPTHVSRREDLFPVGTSVAVYTDRGHGPPTSGAPSGTAITGSPFTVAGDGSLTVTGLETAGKYLLYASSPDRYLRIFVPGPPTFKDMDLDGIEDGDAIGYDADTNTITSLGPVVLDTDIGETVPPVVDEINRFYPFNTASGIGSSSSGGGWSGSQMPHNNASTYPWVVVPVRFPEHWQTCAVDAFWFTPTSGLTGGPKLQVAKLEHDPEGGGLVSASFTASSNVVVGSAALTQYQIYKTTLVSNLVCDPTKLTHLRALRVSLNASADGLAGTIALHRVRLTRAT